VPLQTIVAIRDILYVPWAPYRLKAIYSETQDIPKPKTPMGLLGFVD
jgi:hypothetical protein